MSDYQFVREPNLVGITIRSDSCLCGLPLHRIQLPDGCAVLGLVREGKVLLASSSPTIHCNDHVLAVALNPMLTPALKVALKQRHRVYYSPNNCQIESKESKFSFPDSSPFHSYQSKEVEFTRS